MARNTRLEEARLTRGWSLKEAGERLQVHPNTLNKWELGKHKPHISYLETLCQVYGATPRELGLEELVRSKEHLDSTRPAQLDFPTMEHEVLAEGGTQHDLLSFKDLELHLMVPLLQWEKRDTSYEQLTGAITRQLEQHEPGQESSSSPVSEGMGRRKALRVLAMVPIAAYGLSTLGSNRPTPAEDVLPQLAAGLTACWHLSKGDNLPQVRAIIQSYLPTLTSLAKQPTRYQKPAAGLAAQAHMLAGLMAMHLKSLDAAQYYYQKSVECSRLAEDPNLLGATLSGLASIFSYEKHYQKAVETSKQAIPYITSMSSLVQSNVYTGLGKYQAQCRQKQDALRSLGLAHEIFAQKPEAHSNFIYTLHDRFTLILQDGEAHFYLGRHEQRQTEKALDSYQQVVGDYNAASGSFVGGLQSKMQVPERIRLEFINNMAATALRLKNLEQCCQYLTIGVQGANALGSEQRFSEAYATYQALDTLWGSEPQVRALEGLFVR